MAVENKNISDLAAAASVLGTDLIEIQQGGVNKKASTSQLVLDEDDMVSDSAVKAPSQQSVKAYVDFGVASGWPLTGTADISGAVTIDGNNFDLILGSTNPFDEFEVYADNEILLSVDDTVDSTVLSMTPSEMLLLGNLRLDGLNTFGIEFGGDGILTGDPIDHFIVNSLNGSTITDNTSLLVGGILSISGETRVTSDLFTFKSDHITLLWLNLSAPAGSGSSDRDIFGSYEDSQATITIKAVAVKNDGSEGYSAIKIYDFRKDGTANPTLEGNIVLYENGTDAECNAELSVSASSIRLTYTTPTGDTYKWKVFAEIVITEV
jgi:hypothetical protein